MFAGLQPAQGTTPTAPAGIASAHPLATEAGMEILAAGGNAFDAAVAVTAALAVVEPTGSGLGGGGFWLLHQADKNRDIMLDGRETAPLAAKADMFLDAKGNVIPGLSIDGPLAAAIPGIPAAIAHLATHYGRLPLAASLAPAIRYAKRGFAVSEHYRLLAGFRLDALRSSPAARDIFLQQNEIPDVGFIIKQADLAKTLENIARNGAAGFYAGETADRLINGVRESKGIWTKEDFKAYHVVERIPIVGEFRGLRITSAAPPSAGGIALVTALNILSGYDLDKATPALRTHLVVEAMRRAYRDRAVYLGDPDFVDIPVQRLIHPLYADGLRASLRPDRATPSDMLPGSPAAPAGSDTTHFSIIDGSGNRVAATLSINAPFGSGFVPPGTGVLLNDEMDDFSAKPNTPNFYGLVGQEANAIAPGKRPLSSMTPTFLENDERIAVLGTPGGSRIISMVLLAALDFASGADATHIVSQKRFHHQFLPDALEHEPGALDDQTRNTLQTLGHTLKESRRLYGNMQLLIWNKKTQTLSGASDPRSNGKIDLNIHPTSPSLP